MRLNLADDSQSQTLRAILGLRGLIIDGALLPGQRVSEATLIERIQVSRTPARVALLQVKDEGLIEEMPTGGYVVTAFSEADLFDAIEVRGTLEGMAARLAAERGVGASLMARMQRCLTELDEVVSALGAASDVDAYVGLNDHFHQLIVEASASKMVMRSLEKIMSLPFAQPNAFIWSSRSAQVGVKTLLTASQSQHHAIFGAIRDRQGMRAQALGYEHSFSAIRYLKDILEGIDTSEIPSLVSLARRKRRA